LLRVAGGKAPLEKRADLRAVAERAAARHGDGEGTPGIRGLRVPSHGLEATIQRLVESAQPAERGDELGGRVLDIRLECERPLEFDRRLGDPPEIPQHRAQVEVRLCRPGIRSQQLGIDAGRLVEPAEIGEDRGPAESDLGGTRRQPRRAPISGLGRGKIAELVERIGSPDQGAHVSGIEGQRLVVARKRLGEPALGRLEQPDRVMERRLIAAQGSRLDEAALRFRESPGLTQENPKLIERVGIARSDAQEPPVNLL
jgi:hypothetical protein